MKGLYDPELLENLEACNGCIPDLKPIIPAKGLIVRPLSCADYNAGYIELLSQLTHVGDVSEEQFNETFSKMLKNPGVYYVTVIEDTNTGKVIGAGTLLVEQKFIHCCALRGRIEDIVVSENYRGKQLGKCIIRTLTLLAEKLKCYKLTLDCRDEMRPFYESLGFKKEEGNSNFMQMRFSN